MTKTKIIEVERIAVPPEPWVDEQTMEDTCCVKKTPPACQKTVVPWKGYSTDDVLGNLGLDLDANGYDSSGRKVEIRLIRPPGGICGVKETEYVLEQKNCCEDVAQLAWDNINSAEVCAPNSGCAVAVTGGKGLFTWTVQGVDITFSNGKKTIETSSLYAWLITGPDFCGSAKIKVVDACGQSTNGVVRSTAGQWVELPYGPCYYSGCGEFVLYSQATCIKDNYKVTQLPWSNNSLLCLGCTPAAAAAKGEILCEYPSNEPPCFDVPSEWVPCGNNNYWWFANNASVLLISFYYYKAYEWRC